MSFSAVAPSSIDLQLFLAMPGNNALLMPDAPKFTILAVTEDYCSTSGKTKEELIGQGLCEAFPNPPDDADFTSQKKLYTSLEHTLLKKETHQLLFHRYDILNAEGSFEKHYWSAVNKPVLSNTGEVQYIIHSAIDVTGEVVASKRLETIKGFENAYDFFMAAPVIVGFVRSNDYVIELANEALLEVWGRQSDVIGKPLFEAIPELEEQGFKVLLDEVRTTGKTFSANEFPITLNRHGKEEVLYFDFIYKPFYENKTEHIATGVISVGHDVTAQVLAKRKIEESEAKYRTIFETMDQGFCVLEMIFDTDNQPMDYRFLETNPVFEKHTGLTDAVGKTARMLVPNLEQYWFELYGKVARTGEPLRFSEESKAMGRWFDVYAFRVGDNKSRKVALLFTDITKRRRTEEALRESEERFRSLADQSPMIVYLVEPNERATMSYFNTTWLQYTGQSFEEALGRSWDGIVHPDDVQGVLDAYVPAFENRESYTLPAVRLKRHDGEYRWHLFKGSPRYLPTGEFMGFVGIGLDIHEQKTAEEASKQSEARARLAIASAHLGTFEINVSEQTIVHSARTVEIVGLDPSKQWSYQAIIETVHPDDRPIRLRAHEEAKRTGKLFYEARVVHPDQSIRWIRLNGSLIQQQQQSMVIGTLMDITEEKKAAELLEQKVQDRTRELQQVNDQLKQFTYAASHDLQEPLRKISYFLDHLLVKLAPTLTEDSKKIAERIQHTTGRMRGLIDDLLAYSNTTLGITEFEAVPLAVTVEEVLDDLEATINEKGAVIKVEPLPTVKGDHRQLRQLFQNLISNALKYHKKGEAPLVQIRCQVISDVDENAIIPKDIRKEAFYKIEIKDNGIGFNPNDAERIFRIFQRLHGKAEFEGTGVGLAIVEKVVENHHGYIWAESNPGEGATFNLLLPVG